MALPVVAVTLPPLTTASPFVLIAKPPAAFAATVPPAISTFNPVLTTELTYITGLTLDVPAPVTVPLFTVTFDVAPVTSIAFPTAVIVPTLTVTLPSVFIASAPAVIVPPLTVTLPTASIPYPAVIIPALTVTVPSA